MTPHIHAVNTIDGVDRYDYDLNGSMTVHNNGTDSRQALKSDSHNRLAQVTGGSVNESYLYDETGPQVRKTNNFTGVSTFYPVTNYEQTSSWAVTTHYSFGGRTVAVRNSGGALSFLLQDQINSTVYALDAYANELASRGYYVFGAARFSEGVMPTDHHFTGQREDGTGLYYYKSRFYDPQIGNFISPDTIVPDPTLLIDYNRYLYSRGNPLKYTDPSGHFSEDQLNFFGITRDQVSDTIWDFLQRLEPQDRITGDSFSL